MAWEQDKFGAFWDFLVRINASVETAAGMKDALDKWIEYKNTMRDSVEQIMTDETKEYLEFLRIAKTGGLIQ